MYVPQQKWSSCRNLSSLMTKSQYPEENPVLLRKTIPENPPENPQSSFRKLLPQNQLENPVILQESISQNSPENPVFLQETISQNSPENYHKFHQENPVLRKPFTTKFTRKLSQIPPGKSNSPKTLHQKIHHKRPGVQKTYITKFTRKSSPPENQVTHPPEKSSPPGNFYHKIHQINPVLQETYFSKFTRKILSSRKTSNHKIHQKDPVLQKDISRNSSEKSSPPKDHIIKFTRKVQSSIKPYPKIHQRNYY